MNVKIIHTLLFWAEMCKIYILILNLPTQKVIFQHSTPNNFLTFYLFMGVRGVKTLKPFSCILLYTHHRIITSL
jgi:hypothetical protein